MQTAVVKESAVGDAFGGLVARNRAAGRLQAPEPKAPARRVVLAGMHLMPEERDRARSLAKADDRSASAFMRRLMVWAMDEYEAGRGPRAVQPDTAGQE